MSTSRRDFLATSLAALVSAAFARPGLARVLLRPGQEPAFTPVRRSVGYFTMRGGTIGYLVNDDGVVVVDTQFPASAEAFLKGLATRSDGRPVDVLLNTHHHGDHTGGNSVFRHHRAREGGRAPAATAGRRPGAGGAALPGYDVRRELVRRRRGRADHGAVLRARTRAAMRSSPSSARTSCTWAISCSTSATPAWIARPAPRSGTG